VPNVVLVLCSPTLTKSLVRTLSCLQDTTAFSLGQEALSDFPFRIQDGILCTNDDKHVRIVIADLGLWAVKAFCLRIRLLGSRVPILEALPTRTDVSDALLTALLEYCENPPFLSEEDLALRCRPYIARCLRHDLPKLIPICPQIGGMEFLTYIRTRLIRKPLILRQLDFMLSGYSNIEEGIVALKNEVWRC
jgi:hypothetical protein